MSSVTLRPMMLVWERGRDGGVERGVERGGGRHSWPRDVLSNTAPYDAALGEG